MFIDLKVFGTDVRRGPEKTRAHCRERIEAIEYVDFKIVGYDDRGWRFLEKRMWNGSRRMSEHCAGYAPSCSASEGRGEFVSTMLCD